jgi:hypothetical protein
MAINTTTNKLKITELDFSDIKSAFKEYLSGQSEFTDYNFESSGMDVLLDVLAYNTHYNAFYTNMVASEMFLDSAGIRSNVVSRAKQLGYVPYSKKGSEAVVDITLTNITTGVASITISKGFRFASRISGSTYIFSVTESASAVPVSSTSTTYVASNVVIREGAALNASYTATGIDNERFAIPSPDLDSRSLIVTVNGEIYNLADDYTDVTSTSKVYFLQEGDDELYEVYFGDDVIGKAINVSDSVALNYTISRLGLEGNGAKTFSAAETLSGSTPTVALSDLASPAYGGSSRELVSSIKLKAPRGFELQKRTVTVEDYKTRLVNDYPAIESIKVWGGEENDPPDYGKVYISIKVKDAYSISDNEKKHIKDNILKKRNVVSVSPVFVDPEFLYLVLDADVTFDQRATVQSPVQLKTLATATITGFALSDLNKFEKYFRHSNLLKKIDDSEVGIKNSAVGVKLRKEFTPTLNTALHYELKFANELYHPHSGHMPILTSTLFNHSGYGNCYLEDSDGIISVVTIDAANGNKSYVNRTAGTVDYITGKISLENFNPTAIEDGTSKISVTAIPTNTNILSSENIILSILDTDLTITMVDDSDVSQDISPNY